MRQHWNDTIRYTILTVGCTLIVAVATALAQDASVLVQPQAAPPEAQPVAPPVLQAPAPVQAEPMPAPTVTEAAVHPAPPIAYHTGLRARRMLRCQEQVQLVMVTKNPVDCCLYEIPLCVPACCEGQPTMREGRGLLGRGIVEYCWPCGFKAKVKFRPVLCDVKVDYSA